MLSLLNEKLLIGNWKLQPNGTSLFSYFNLTSDSQTGRIKAYFYINGRTDSPIIHLVFIMFTTEYEDKGAYFFKDIRTRSKDFPQGGNTWDFTSKVDISGTQNALFHRYDNQASLNIELEITISELMEIVKFSQNEDTIYKTNIPMTLKFYESNKDSPLCQNLNYTKGKGCELSTFNASLKAMEFDLLALFGVPAFLCIVGLIKVAFNVRLAQLFLMDEEGSNQGSKLSSISVLLIVGCDTCIISFCAQTILRFNLWSGIIVAAIGAVLFISGAFLFIIAA